MREFITSHLLKSSSSFSNKPSSHFPATSTAGASNLFRSLALLAFKICLTCVLLFFWPLTLAFYVYYETHHVEAPRLYYNRTSQRSKSLLSKCPSLHKEGSGKFRPHPIVALPFGISGHLMTLVNELSRGNPPAAIKFDRHVLDLADGGTVALDTLVTSAPLTPESPVVLIIHGVTGSSQSAYIQHFAQLLSLNSIRPVVLTARGCGDTRLSTPRHFNCGETSDIHASVLYLRDKYPMASILGVGFSMGANLLCKYVGEQGQGCVLKAAVCVACPFDWMQISAHLSKWFERHVYNFFLTKSLVSFVQRHKETFEKAAAIDLESVLHATTLQEFDSRFTVPLFNFKSLTDYYESSSCNTHLPAIKIPLLVIQALDDPIIPHTVIPYSAFLSPSGNPNLMLCTTKGGGHVAWMQHKSWLWGGWFGEGCEYNWADEVAVEFVNSVLDHISASEETKDGLHKLDEGTTLGKPDIIATDSQAEVASETEE